MLKPNLKISAILCSAAMLLGACGEGEPNDITVVEEIDTLEEEFDVDLFESPEIDYHLPSPLQVASIFKKSGLEYNSGVTNTPDKASNYTEELSQMLNIRLGRKVHSRCPHV